MLSYWQVSGGGRTGRSAVGREGAIPDKNRPFSEKLRQSVARGSALPYAEKFCC